MRRTRAVHRITEGVAVGGGDGRRLESFALEYPISRVLCDSRIEGAAEIQAQVITRRLLEGAN